MKITLLTYCDKDFDRIGAITIPIISEYCKVNSFEFVIHSTISTNHKDIYWNKIGLVKQNLASNDWVIWCDADIIINWFYLDWNAMFKRHADKSLLVSSDFNGLCLGFFVIKANQWSINLLDIMEKLGDINKGKIGVYHRKFQREQDTIKVLADFFAVINDQILLLPEEIIANPKSEINGTIPFAFHFWASRGAAIVEQEMKQYLTRPPNSKD